VPFPPPPHAAVHVPPAHVGVPFAHPTQAPPVAPQAPLAVPATHCAASGSQQPPLHAVSPAAPHAAPQVCVFVLHACPLGQSVATLQPQVPFASHAEPAELLAQFVQAPPLVPHAFAAVPPTHVTPLQQPPLHGVSFAAPHAVEHVCVCVLHELPEGQSVAAPQPQVSVPDSQTWPAALVLQLAHRAPFPQAPVAVPTAHWPATGSQQPPLQAVLLAPPHVLPQVWVVVLHDEPLGQSAAALQPHASVLAMQALPFALPVQSTHAPEPPQAVWLVPG